MEEEAVAANIEEVSTKEKIQRPKCVQVNPASVMASKKMDVEAMRRFQLITNSSMFEGGANSCCRVFTKAGYALRERERERERGKERDKGSTMNNQTAKTNTQNKNKQCLLSFVTNFALPLSINSPTFTYSQTYRHTDSTHSPDVKKNVRGNDEAKRLWTQRLHQGMNSSLVHDPRTITSARTKSDIWVTT